MAAEAFIDPRARFLYARKEYLRDYRRDLDLTIEDVQRLTVPLRGELDTVGDIRQQRGERQLPVSDNTGQIATHNLIQHVVGQTFPPGVDWLKVGPSSQLDRRFRTNFRLRELYTAVGLRVLEALSESPWYVQAPEAVRDLLILGSWCMLSEKMKPTFRGPGQSTFRGVSYRHIEMSRVWWQLDRQGHVMFLCAEYVMPAMEAWEWFGADKVMMFPSLARTLTSESMNPMEPFTFTHFVFPSENQRPFGVQVDSNKKYASFWGFDETSNIIDEGGFDEMPYGVEVWNRVNNDSYGYGLGTVLRADMASLNMTKSMQLEALPEELGPMLAVEKEQQISAEEGYRAIATMTDPKAFVPQFINPNVDLGTVDAIIRIEQGRIEKYLLGDITNPRDTEPRSAFESRRQEAIAFRRTATFIPAVSRAISAEVTKLINHMVRQNDLPELEEIKAITGEERVTLDFVSPLFTLQRSTAVSSALAFVAQLLEVGQQKPEVWDPVNLQKFTQIFAELTDVPPGMLLNDGQVAERVDARASQQRAELQLQALQEAGREALAA